MSKQTWVGVVFTALLAGCAATRVAPSEPATGEATAPTAQEGTGMSMDMCPMKVSGTTVTSVDVEGGAALEFSTNEAGAAALRERVRHMADMHNQHHAAGGTMMGSDGARMMPAATASVEDTPSGARLVLNANDPTQIGVLRDHVRMVAARMASGDCLMMSPAEDRPASPPAAGDHGAHHPPGQARP